MDCKMTPEAKMEELASDKYRMWAAVAFAVMLIIIGVPLWWKTTEVYRAPLPYEEIWQLDPATIDIGMNIFIYTEYPTRGNDLVKHLLTALSNLEIFKVKYELLKLPLNNVTVESVENYVLANEINPGDVLIAEVSELPQKSQVLISNDRILYFTRDTELEVLSTTFKDLLLNEEKLKQKVLSIVSPQSLNESESLTQLRSSLNYDVVFTIINSNPEQINLKWDVAKDINGYVKPLLDQISLASKHFVKSQWLYFTDLGEVPKMISEWNTLTFSQLPHIITPLEKKLGSGTSTNPCIHLILYVTSCTLKPLIFLSPDSTQHDSMISPQWGGIQILNPSDENCSNFTILKPDSKKIMATFLSQLHNLLGKTAFDVELMEIQGGLLRKWELDSLYRMRTVEQITSASLTLQSLSKLLGEISNIVINEDVASSINNAIHNVQLASRSLRHRNLISAIAYSRLAYKSAETAFSDPSLLALLYFPDDQKYAVYIPLYLPIMIPVLMSLKKIQTWLFYGISFYHEKTD